MFQFAFPSPCPYIRTSPLPKPSISAVAALGGRFDGFVGAREISEAVGMGIKFLDWRCKSECEGYGDGYVSRV